MPLMGPSSWREFNSEVSTTHGITFVNLRVGPSQLCVHNRLTASASDSATTSTVPSMEGDFCYPLRTTTTVRLLEQPEAGTVTLASLDICDRSDTSLRELLGQMGVPSDQLVDASTTVKRACSVKWLALHVAALVTGGLAVVGGVVALFLRWPKRDSFHLSSVGFAVLSVDLHFVELMGWFSPTSQGEAGASVNLCFAALALQVMGIIGTVSTLGAQGARDIVVSPRPTERLV